MSTLRAVRQRRDVGLRAWIVPLYTRPVLKYLSEPEYEPVKNLIYGMGSEPPKGCGARRIWDREAERLRPLWMELRQELLAAAEIYSPNVKPWGVRFDQKTKSPDCSRPSLEAESGNKAEPATTR